MSTRTRSPKLSKSTRTRSHKLVRYKQGTITSFTVIKVESIPTKFICGSMLQVEVKQRYSLHFYSKVVSGLIVQGCSLRTFSLQNL